MPTIYDRVAYPTRPMADTQPDRLFAIARLHGLAPPPPAGARVLEIGGGDGGNLIAFAAAHPDSRCLSFDLSEAAAARGRHWIAAAGLENIVVRQGDIVAEAGSLDGAFDYVICHGVYSWVPASVRAAVLRLIGRVLAPDGIAFVSYNALPGGHFRRAIRDRLLRVVADVTGDDARLQAAHDWLVDFARPRDGDALLQRALREVAAPMADRDAAVLFHDELGEVWEPQAMVDVVAAAAGEGLMFLNDALSGLTDLGLPGAGTDMATLLAKAQALNDDGIAFFHKTLLVRDGAQPARALDTDAMGGLWVSSLVERTGPMTFRAGKVNVEVDDAMLADGLARLRGLWPQRLPVAELAPDPERRRVLYRVHTTGAITLHGAALPGVRVAGERPVASPLARAQAAAGLDEVHTLDQRVVTMKDAGPKRFLALLDGTRDRSRIAADWAASGHGHEVGVDAALNQFAASALLVA